MRYSGKMVSYTAAVDPTDCLETGIPRQSENITPSRSVCRNLFGTMINHNDYLEETRKRNIERLEEKKQQYNFDFEKDEPLLGRYHWEKVSNFTTRNCCKLAIQSKPIAKRRNSKAFSKTDSKTNGKSPSKAQEHKITGKDHIFISRI